jgi:hypothetical protein
LWLVAILAFFVFRMVGVLLAILALIVGWLEKRVRVRNGLPVKKRGQKLVSSEKT